MADEERQDEEQVDVQKRYLMAKIDELIEGVGPGYSEALMEELITRMERTVAHFHEEVIELLESLKSRAKERNKKLETLVKEKGVEKEVEGEEAVTSAESEMSEWEKKLEAEKKEGEGETESGETAAQEKEKKKGLFGRKKKD